MKPYTVEDYKKFRDELHEKVKQVCRFSNGHGMCYRTKTCYQIGNDEWIEHYGQCIPQACPLDMKPLGGERKND